MKKLGFKFLVLWVSIVSTVFAENDDPLVWRTWTTTAGTSIEAKFVRYTSRVVVLKHKDDDGYTSVKIGRLVKTDREYIAELLRSQDPWTFIPATMRMRFSMADRLGRIHKYGGTEQSETAVKKSLRWLKKTQNADGSWCNEKKVASTGLALLAFLGHGDTPNSEEFGDTVVRAIAYLVNISMKNKGKIAQDFKGHWAYEHGIATYALGEAATFCKALSINIPNLYKATKMSGDWILKHQHESGTWAYHYEASGGHCNNSVGVWQIQALKACKHTGLWKKNAFKDVIQKSLIYIKQCQNPNGGIGYSSANGSKIGWTMTGAGALAYQLWGRSDDEVVKKASKYIKTNAKFDWNTANSDLYRHYYYAQVMINCGREDWKFYNKLFRDQVVKNQKADGTWNNVGGGKKVYAVSAEYQGTSKFAIHYRTCLATLMLEAYYRNILEQ